MKKGDVFEFQTEQLSYGRGAVSRSFDKVAMITRAAPEETVRARLVREHSSWLDAETVEVVEPGPTRVAPPCSYFETCGGCPWQHVDYEAQLQAKRHAVASNLERIGGIEKAEILDVAPSPQTLGYRNRLKLRFDKNRLGFYSARTHHLVPIDDCLVAEDRVRLALPQAEALVANLQTRVTRVEIASRGLEDGVMLAINSQGRLRRSDGEIIKRHIGDTQNETSGVIMWGRGWRRQWGETTRVYRVADPFGSETEIRSEVASFGQVNSDANRELVKLVLATLKPGVDEVVLDLYAGAGNFTLPAARHVRRITGVEADAALVEAGRESAGNARIQNISFRHDSVEEFVDKSRGKSWDRIIVNPPRSGLAAAAKTIAGLRAAAITYVSCNPATLARDIRDLASAGYNLTSVRPLDMFPHTFHVESVVDLRLGPC